MLICAATILINLSSEVFNSRELKIVNRAKHVCKTDSRYTDTPCLSKFIKKEPHNYVALCGAKKLKKASAVTKVE